MSTSLKVTKQSTSLDVFFLGTINSQPNSLLLYIVKSFQFCYNYSVKEPSLLKMSKCSVSLF
nr:MAG TPA: hypothetical protein [Caudoviricetes sp.]